MTKDKIIDGLKMTMELIVFDPSTGETIDPDNLNELNRITYDACQGAIKELQNADVQPVVHWIPCSERLPIYGEPVLTWDGVTYCVEKRIPCIRDEHGEPIYSDWWVSDDYDELDSEYYPNLRDGACIAWMPLPERYQEGEQDE